MLNWPEAHNAQGQWGAPPVGEKEQLLMPRKHCGWCGECTICIVFPVVLCHIFGTCAWTLVASSPLCAFPGSNICTEVVAWQVMREKCTMGFG